LYIREIQGILGHDNEEGCDGFYCDSNEQDPVGLFVINFIPIFSTNAFPFLDNKYLIIIEF
jgi:hypothetical protein